MDEPSSRTDKPMDIEEEGRQLDRRIRERIERFEKRRSDEKWWKCGKYFPTEHAISETDATCCQENEAAIAVCNKIEKFKEANMFKCVTQHRSFCRSCLHKRPSQDMRRIYSQAGFKLRVLYRMCR